MTAPRTIHGAASPDIGPLLRSLGLFQQAANKPKLDQRALDRFAAREVEFDWVHMGNSELRIRQLVEVLQQYPSLSPPRTGHLGNWSNIVEGRAGPRDYNNLTCGRHGIGYPLLFDFNQTESDTPGLGDWSYMPGSVVRGTTRRELRLFTWDGHAFASRDRSLPLFAPFTLAERQGALIPLCTLHREACQSQVTFRFRFQSTLLNRCEATIRRIFRVLLEHASRQDDPNQHLRRMFDRCVGSDGRVERMALQWELDGFRMGDIRYPDAEALIDHVVLPIMAAADPRSFPDLVKELPDQMPVISASLFVLLLAVLNTHYPDIDDVPPYATSPCNPHLHWGGIPMAGYPPGERGYFADNARHLRRLFQPVIRAIPEISPVLLVLLPAGIFNLCPHGAFPQDVEISTRLMRLVSQRSSHLLGRPAEMNRAIEMAVAEWHATEAAGLSSYFISRFAARPRVISSLPASVAGELVLPSAFLELTVQQASMTMGALSRFSWMQP